MQTRDQTTHTMNDAEASRESGGRPLRALWRDSAPARHDLGNLWREVVQPREGEDTPTDRPAGAPAPPSRRQLRQLWGESSPARAELKKLFGEAVRSVASSATDGHPAKLRIPRDRMYYLLAGGLGLTYFTTGFAKSLDVRGFRHVLDTYQLYPQVLHWPIAAGMTYTEMFLAYSFLSGKKLHPFGLIGSYVISGGGAIVLFTELARGIDLPNCGCWGVFFANPLKWFTPWEDVVMVAMTIGVQMKLSGRWPSRGEKTAGPAALAPSSADDHDRRREVVPHPA